MITQYFMTQDAAWLFALNLDKNIFQVINYGKNENISLPYFVSYAKR